METKVNVITIYSIVVIVTKITTLSIRIFKIVSIFPSLVAINLNEGSTAKPGKECCASLKKPRRDPFNCPIIKAY